MKKGIFSLGILTSLFIVIFGTQSSCEKDNVVTSNLTDTIYRCSPNIKGLWEGTMTDAITQPFFLSLKSDGTCTSENISPGTQENLSFGSWNISGTDLTVNLLCKYGYITNLDLQMDFSGVYDSTQSKIIGTFHLQSPSGATENGTFELTRVN